LKVLAIETATPCVGCALWSDAGPVASFVLVAGQRHAEVLMPAVDELCRRAGWTVDDLSGVAVDIGPGLFTGLRVGVATARAIAAATGLPAAGVNSLETLAHPHRRRTGLVAPVVDARRGEVYWALYRADGTSVQELRPPAVAGPRELAAELGRLCDPVLSGPTPAGPTPAGPTPAGPTPAGPTPAGPVLAVGDGARRYKEHLVASGADVGDEGEMWPSPLVVAELGVSRLTLAAGGEGGLPEPLYLRQPDVRIGWEEVGGRAGGQPGTSPGPSPSEGASHSTNRGPGHRLTAGPGGGPSPAATARAAASSPGQPKLAP
jgi:tRNA threonylcarbamoyladenosine biosynthesis protein TsaB